MRKPAKKMQLYTVREAPSGGLCGHYMALTPEAAINRFWQDQAATAATFRRSQPFRKFPVSAAVEPPYEWKD